MNPPYNEKRVKLMEDEIVIFLKEKGFEPGPELTVAMVGSILSLGFSAIIEEMDKGDGDG